ncbi:MAG: cytochrome c [Thermoleophilia bacterium]|nr:cytochrome c [Thermoleophilia bacterium]
MRRTALVLVVLAGALVLAAAGCGGGEEQVSATETTPSLEGDPVAGKAVYTGASACIGCHALADAGATATVGPNLDDTMPSAALVVDRVTNGQGGMPPFGNTLTEQQIADVAAYISSVAGK